MLVAHDLRQEVAETARALVESYGWTPRRVRQAVKRAAGRGRPDPNARAGTGFRIATEGDLLEDLQSAFLELGNRRSASMALSKGLRPSAT
jgi:hypothetical protein